MRTQRVLIQQALFWVLGGFYILGRFHSRTYYTVILPTVRNHSARQVYSTSF